MHSRLPSERELVPGENRGSAEAAEEAAGAGLHRRTAHRADSCYRRWVIFKGNITKQATQHDNWTTLFQILLVLLRYNHKLHSIFLRFYVTDQHTVCDIWKLNENKLNETKTELFGPYSGSYGREESYALQKTNAATLPWTHHTHSKPWWRQHLFLSSVKVVKNMDRGSLYCRKETLNMQPKLQ